MTAQNPQGAGTFTVTPCAIPDVCLVSVPVHRDARGHFFERFHREKFAELGLPTEFPQDNASRSQRGVLRGLHYQLTRPQGKLVTCTRGRIFDVAADVRLGSPTFGKWVGVTLAEDAPQWLWIPPGFAHGFCALADVVDVEYKCTALYSPPDERGILWSDADLAIDWPLRDPVLSTRDAALPTLTRAELPR